MLNMLLLRISSWSLSSSNSEKIGCILLLDELIDALPVKEMEKKMSQFANELSVIIVNQNKARNFNSEVVDLAVRSLGHLGKAVNADDLYEEVDRVHRDYVSRSEWESYLYGSDCGCRGEAGIGVDRRWRA